MMAIHAGQLTEPLVLEQRSEVDQDDGSTATTWTFVANVPANVRGLRGTELFEAQQMTPQADHKVSFRTIAELRPGEYRFQWFGKILSITSVRYTDLHHRWQECSCGEEP